MEIQSNSITQEDVWELQMKTNQSFLGRVNDICNLLNIKRSELKKYWCKSEWGLIYILKFARENKRLP